MGYTHNWYRPQTIPPATFQAITKDFLRVLPALEAAGSSIANADGVEEPEFTAESIQSNGIRFCGHTPNSRPVQDRHVTQTRSTHTPCGGGSLALEKVDIVSALDDWIFASRVHNGKHPMWPGTVLQKIIQPASCKAGITKHVGWHTFRHTYSTLLIANGENVRVVQELMRHASSHFTLQLYSQAQARTKRAAQLRLTEALL